MEAAVVNDECNGVFDGVIVTVGTCGDPKMPRLSKQDQYHGRIVHPSELDGEDVRGKKVSVVGGGASTIEALEYAVGKGASQTTILARVSAVPASKIFIV